MITHFGIFFFLLGAASGRLSIALFLPLWFVSSTDYKECVIWNLAREVAADAPLLQCYVIFKLMPFFIAYYIL